MTDREAMQQALEALEFFWDNGYRNIAMKQKTTMDALRERLAQPEQEPMALQTVYETIIHWDEGGGKRSRRELARRIVDLYTTPPQRTWVGLTDREVELLDGMIEVQLHHANQCDRMANRVMADKQKGWDMERVELLRKLKEKNT